MSLNPRIDHTGAIKRLEELLQQSREINGYCPASGLKQIGDQVYGICRYKGGGCKYRVANNIKDPQYNIEFNSCTFNAKEDTHIMPKYQR